MKQVRSVLTWIDQHALVLLAYFLVAFIPLYPKLPLFEAIPGYIVRVRIEDIVIAFTGIVWLVQLIRKKITWKTPLTWAIGAYAVVGLLSTISAVLITQTVPAELLHIGKTALHYFRYLEYFFIFFVVVTTIRTPEHFKRFFILTVGVLIALAIYGFGQRYYRWPVYSTMNREFSKGIRLVLSEHARVQSTFGGHYDLAAYLVIVLPLLLAGMYNWKSKWVRLVLGISFTGGLWLITQTSSRSSFLGFMIGSYIVIGIYALLRSSWWQRIRTLIAHGTLYSIFVLIFILKFGDDMYERFLQTLKGYPALHDQYHTINKYRKELLSAFSDHVIARFVTEDQLVEIQNSITATPPPNVITTDEATAQVVVSSDTRPTPAKPSDVYVDVPDITYVSTTSADGTVTVTQVETERTYSQTAIDKGLSAGIRYDTLWPRALAGFQRNPVLGSGYATLTKETTGQFTEAESTDNNFLRTLGETGLLGFVTFYGVVLIALRLAYTIITESKEKMSRMLAIGFVGGAVGLLVNAIYIDVFAASKVAFTFWAVVGVVTAAYLYHRQQRTATSTTQTTREKSKKKKQKK